MSICGRLRKFYIIILILGSGTLIGFLLVHGDPVYDFVQSASSATWYSRAGSLPFPGSTSDSRGFALNLVDAQLEDDSVYPLVLESHPQWVADGYITGVYPVQSIASNTRLRVKTGLLKGATGSDGVNFEVMLDINQVQHSLINVHSSYDGKLDETTADLSQYAGQSGRFILTVRAGKSSGQDWAVWAEAEIESTALPDLTVTDIVLSGNTISYKLKNAGSASVGGQAAPASFTNLLMVDGKQVAYDPYTGTLSPGQQVTRSFNYVFKQTPPYNVVRVCADWDQKVAEEDEGNNCLEEVWGYGYPDLKANGLIWSPSTVTIGHTVHLVPDIENIGEANSTPCKVEFKSDDSAIGILNIPAIPVGMRLSDVDSQLSLPWVPEEAGDHEITFTVDSEDTVEEGDEANNQAGDTIEVLPEDNTPPTASIYPTPLKLFGEPINEMDDITFVAGASDASGIQSITIYVDGMAKKTVYDSTTCTYHAGSLPRLSTVHYAAGVYDKAGNYYLTPTYFLTVASYYSQPSQVDIEVSPSEPTEVDTVTFTATASYPYGIDKLRIYLNGHKVSEEENATTLSISRSPWASGSTVSYFAEAIDVDGRTRRTPERSFTVGGLERFNVKNIGAYVDREIFVVSDLDWRLVCQLVPIAVWKEMHPTEPVAVGSTYSFPVLIYHEEDEGRFDADSVIRFIEQYAEYGRNRYGLRVTILGDPPDELVRLIGSTVFMETRETDRVRVWRPMAATTTSTIVSLRSTVIDGGRDMGSTMGLGGALMDRWGVTATITEGATGVVPMDDLYTDEEERSLREEYWSTLNVYVLSEDEYSTALMASVYASLLDAPLILQGHYDVDELYHRSVYMVGDFTDDEVEELRSAGVNILSRLTLNELRRNYVAATATNKLILVNPLDLWTTHRRDYVTDEGGTVSYLFGKHSLASPFLAADKKEVIISIPSSSYPEIDAYVKESFETLMPGSGLKYLTIMATPEAIPIARANVPSPVAINGDTIYYQGQRYIDTDIVVNSLRGDDEAYLFTEPRMQFSPACSGDVVAWVDEDTWGDIWYRRVPMGSNIRLTGASAPWSGQCRPAVYGTKIVWQDGRNGNWDIYMYNVNTGITLRITNSADGDEWPSMWGNRIVWQRSTGRYWRIMSYDITTRTETQVSPSEYYTFERPSIWENRVVYVSNRGGENWDVYMSTLGTSIATIRVTNNPSMQWNPKIYDDHIVWQDNRNGDWDIYMYTISTATETRLTTETIDQVLPSIWGDNIIWLERGTDGFWYIVNHDLRTGLTRRITRTEVSADDGPLWLELDGRYYGSNLNMGRQDIATGRIYGITVADASAYVARDLFYERINKNRDALVVVREDHQTGIDDPTSSAWLEPYARSHYWTDEIEDHFRDVYFYAGHDEVDPNSRTIYNKYDEVGLVVFVDHGIMDGFESAMDSYHMQNIKMQMQPVTVIDLACLTGAYNVMATVGDPTDLMSAQNIRRGAMVYMGATDVSYWHNMFDNILNGLYNDGRTIGEVYMEARNEDYDEDVWCFSLTLRGDIFYALHGDPTFKPKWEGWETEEAWYP
jgi:beta propeller repeat protein